MKQFNSGYKGDHKSMFIISIGDMHIGSKYYNPAYLERALKFADKHRSRTRIILMGDMLELATKTSVGRAVYEEEFPTYKQYCHAIDLFKPYADIIDLVLDGNHEERIIRDTSFEIVEEFCKSIGRHDAYGRFEGIVNYKLGTDLTYSLYAWHGASGGTKEASAVNGLLNMRERAIAHIYCMGHTHKLFDFSRKVRVPNPGAPTPAVIEQLFVNTGTSLDDGGYGAQKGFPMQRIGFGAIQLFADKRKQVFHYIDDLID